jgi:hypothetical protein
MLNKAYAVGYQKAIQDFGTEKIAIFGTALKGLAAHGGLLGRAAGAAAKNPLAAKTIAGAGIGGTAGAIGGDEGGFMRGALTGGAAGVGAHLGGRVASGFPSLGRAGALGAGALGAGATGYSMSRGFVPGANPEPPPPKPWYQR